ncbi:hypothetical protein TELCIR_12457 [Teladorsagia circumcincta]|uniref:Uncharacterized protein n=1 Tax=Teladorsagia circumcincta TaxID=45464 RepID=A0A2G9U827_TELCI|nr:hypothetical protein TELCIR_12457 [Teladorsagia circumcincta]
MGQDLIREATPGPRAQIVDIASTVLYLHLSDKQKQGVESLTNGVLEGYHRVRELPDCTHLITAMKARLSCSLIYGLRTARLNFRGGSLDYVLRTQSNGWSVLQVCWNEKSSSINHSILYRSFIMETGER